MESEKHYLRRIDSGTNWDEFLIEHGNDEVHLTHYGWHEFFKRVENLEEANVELNEMLKKHEQNQNKMLETIGEISIITDKIIEKLIGK